MTESVFKVCGCGRQWKEREEFLSDPDVRLAGYQVNFVELRQGFFLFNHIVPRCGSTLAVVVDRFVDLYSGAVFTRRASGSSECPGSCLRRGDLTPCPVECECAYVRHVLEQVSRWPKAERAAGGGGA